MSQWVVKGIRTGIKTTAYPRGEEHAAGVTPGLPSGGPLDPATAAALVDRCPTNALTQTGDGISVDYRRCVHCYRCARGVERPLEWQHTYEWAAARDPHNTVGRSFKRSIHIIVVDAGDCGACLNEVKQLNNPYYNMHRLGFFITPSPRHADVLLVVGPVTDHIRDALQKTYDAMPGPKRVMAVGAAPSPAAYSPTALSAPRAWPMSCPWTWKSPEIPRRRWRFCTVCSYSPAASRPRRSPVQLAHEMMNPQTLILLALAACGAGIVLSLVMPFSRQGTLLAWLGGLAGVAMAAAGTTVLITGRTFTHSLWSLPPLGTRTFSLDTLSAVFVAVTGLVLVPASIFAAAESGRDATRRGRRAFTVMMFALYASILVILIAGDVLLFLLAWEVMSILCYLLIVCGSDSDNGGVDAGYLLLAMGEAGTVAAVLAFLFLAVTAGSLNFGAIKSGVTGLARASAGPSSCFRFSVSA